MNYLMNGNSTFGKRYGYVCNMSQIYKELPLCHKCLTELREYNKYNNRECKKCLRWDIKTNRKLAEAKPPKNYPAEMVPKERKLPIVVLNWKYLK